MSAKEAIRLFATDCEISVFSAEIKSPRLHVNVYPRKSRPGFIWIVRCEMDLNDIDACVVDGGIIPGAKTLRTAADLALYQLFDAIDANRAFVG